MAFIDSLIKRIWKNSPLYNSSQGQPPNTLNSASDLTGVGQIWNDMSGTTATQNFNALEAEKTRKHQIDMAQNQYQWAVDDIKKAGLNPALMYASGGQGNTAPSGASASSGSGSIGEVLGAVGQIMNGINSARALDARTKDQFDDKVTSYMYDDLGRIMKQVVYRQPGYNPSYSSKLSRDIMKNSK